MKDTKNGLTKKELFKKLKNSGFKRNGNNCDSYEQAKREFNPDYTYPYNQWIAEYLNI